MKHILMLATGGTIASRQSGHGLAPALTGEELLDFLPQISRICKVTVINPMSMDSTDMTADNRMTIASLIWGNLDNYDGFVVAHGTDTLAYTSTLLFHVLKNIDKPIIITGSQKPVGEENSDAEKNLLHAFRAAASDYKGVATVVQGEIIRGSNVVKVHTVLADAFKSVNAPVDGIISDDGKVEIHHMQEITGDPVFMTNIDKSVVLLKLTPDLDPSILDFLSKYNKVIIEAFGAGGVPTRLEKVMQKLVMKGTKVYITTQCLAGGANLKKYEVGRRAESLGAVCLGNRTSEDALASVMCGEI